MINELYTNSLRKNDLCHEWAFKNKKEELIKNQLFLSYLTIG